VINPDLQKPQAPWIALVILVASTGRRVVSATMSLAEAPQRQMKTRCSMFANLGCRSDRNNDVGRPQASQLGFLGVFVRMTDAATRWRRFGSDGTE
jgi:hypothetical protein